MTRRDRDLIRVTEASRILGVSRAWGYVLAKDGRLPGSFWVGDSLYVHKPTLLEAIADRLPK